MGDVRHDPRLEVMAGWLRRTAQPEEIILFGSRAKGTERENSDADFLTIMPGDTPRARMDALLLEVQEFNASSPIRLDLHPRTGTELCEELSVRWSRISERAMEHGILFFPEEGKASRYAEFARVWRFAWRIRIHLLPSQVDLGDAEDLLAAGHAEPVAPLLLRSIDEAVRALLAFAGADVPPAMEPNPLQALAEYTVSDESLLEPLLHRSDEFDGLARLSEPIPAASGRRRWPRHSASDAKFSHMRKASSATHIGPTSLARPSSRQDPICPNDSDIEMRTEIG